MSRQVFPLKRFYVFGNVRGRTQDVARIKPPATVPPSKKRRSSTFRRGKAIKLLERKDLLAVFLKEQWRYGLTPDGDREMRACKRFSE